MGRRYCVKKAAILMVAASVALSSVSGMNMFENTVNAAVSVNSTTIKLGDTVNVSDRSNTLKFVPTQTGRYVLYSEGTDSVYCKIMDSQGQILSTVYPSSNEKSNFSVSYEMSAGVTYYYEISSTTQGSQFASKAKLVREDSVKINVSYLNGNTSHHTTVSVVKGQGAQIGIGALCSTEQGELSYTWYSYNALDDTFTCMDTFKGEVVNISNIENDTPTVYRCLVSNGIVSEEFIVELLVNKNSDDLANNAITIQYDQVENCSFEDDSQRSKVYRFTPSFSGEYVIFATDSGTVDNVATRVELYDENGKYLGYNESTQGNKFVLFKSLEVGKTYFYSIAQISGANNSFDVCLKKADDVRLKVAYDDNYDMVNNVFRISSKSGQTTTVSIGATINSHYGKISYSWFKNEKEIEGQVLDNFKINSIKKADEGTYICRATNGLDAQYYTVVVSVEETVSEKVETTTYTDYKNNTTFTNNETNKISINIKKPGKVKIKSAIKKASAKKATITIKKLNGVSGYEVKVSSSKKFKKKETVTIKSKKLVIKVKRLKSNKNYFVKVRAYIVVNGQKKYGSYSNKTRIKMK